MRMTSKMKWQVCIHMDTMAIMVITINGIITIQDTTKCLITVAQFTDSSKSTSHFWLTSTQSKT